MLSGTSDAILSTENLPDEVTTIKFDSGYHFHQAVNVDPFNKIELTLSFHIQNLLDFSNPSGRLTTPISFYNIVGNNETWVNGVYESVKSFFKTKELKRNLIHGKYIYDLLLWLIVLPSIFWTLYRASNILQSHAIFIPTPLNVSLYVYFTFALLIIFRLLFNYLRWLYPLIEFTDSRVKRSRFHKAVLFAIITGLLGSLIVDLVKAICF